LPEDSKPASGRRRGSAGHAPEEAALHLYLGDLGPQQALRVLKQTPQGMHHLKGVS